MLSNQKIKFHFIARPFFFPHRSTLKRFIVFLLKNEGYVANQLNYIFCTDDYLIQINKKYLRHNYFTDIITFSLAPPTEPIFSDIYISIERVKANSYIFKTTFNEELHRVIFHGTLHLCGYKDKTKAQKKRIRNKENFYLESYFVSRETKTVKT